VRIDHRCAEFERQWQSNEPPSLESWLAEDVAPLERDALLAELIVLDLDYRRRRGDEPSEQEYLDRFPNNSEAVHDAFKGGGKPSGAFTPPTIDELSKLFPSLQIIELIGAGGMGAVYKARQIDIDRLVAIKILPQEFGHDVKFALRFTREARTLAKLNHPNIVQVIDVGNAGPHYFIAQELVDGENLRQTLERVGTLGLEDALEVLVGVAAALEIASEAGITHRDIKPENVMRSSRGIIKVADFGLARLGADVATSRADLTQAGLTLGTPRYMSPEQVQGKPVDVRSDLYSLGVTMYHLLAGRPPFEADDPLALALMHLHETPPPLDRTRDQTDAEGNPDLPEWLIAVITRLMSKMPGDRYQSPGELLDAVRNETAHSNLGGFGVGTAAATIRLQRATDAERQRRRKRQMRIATAVLLPTICTGLAAAFAFQRPLPDVAEVLSPDVAPEEESVEAQFLYAMRRNDETAWRSVGEYFPPEANSTNAAYHAKALIQLAQLMTEKQQFREADRTLEQLLRSPNVDRSYQAVALARQYFVLEQMGDKSRQAEAKREFQSMYQDFKTNNPTGVQILDRVLSDSELLQLGIDDT